MGLDLRWPIGLMFSLIGALLTLTGAMSKAEAYERSLGLNINLWWGLVLLAFGVFMLLMARKGAKTTGPGATTSADKSADTRR
jgi:hypothetical protein